MKQLYRLIVLLATVLLVGCATTPEYDYTAFIESKPTSILVLPPQNDSAEVAATNSLLAQATYPLAEGGYYVFPVALVVETFRQNGLTEPAEIQAVPYARLREVFGADAALYLTVEEYGTSYHIISSNTVVTANATLVDLRTGEEIWEGSATASSAEQRGAGSGGFEVLIQAVVYQVLDTLTDKGYEIAGITSGRLLGAAGPPNRMLYGPYSPYYEEHMLY